MVIAELSHVTPILLKYISQEHIDEVVALYAQTHRKYHTLDHVIKMWNAMVIKEDELYVAIFYHDAIYSVTSGANEMKSVDLFKQHYKQDDVFAETVERLIMTTATPFATDVKEDPVLVCAMEYEMKRLDTTILFSNDFNELLRYEQAIFHEFQCFSITQYKEGRIEFLRKAHMFTQNPLLLTLIDYIEAKQYKIGFYAGSFNPFHKGHFDILCKAEAFFDKVIIGRGQNSTKVGQVHTDLPVAITNREIVVYTGLITDHLEQLGKQDNVNVVLVRGLRNEYDLPHEESLRVFINQKLPHQQFMYLFGSRENEFISSSLVRELLKYNAEDTLAQEYLTLG